MSSFTLHKEHCVLIDNNILTPYAYGLREAADTNQERRLKLTDARYHKVTQLLAFVDGQHLVSSKLLEIEAVSGMRRQRAELQTELSGYARQNRSEHPRAVALRLFLDVVERQIAVLEGILGRAKEQGISNALLDQARGEIEKYRMGTVDALHVATVAAFRERVMRGRGRSRQQRRRTQAVFVTLETRYRGQEVGREVGPNPTPRPLYQTDLATVVRLDNLDIPA